MKIGPTYVVNMNHLLLVVQRFPKLSHGLSLTNIKRPDRHNWKVAQELCFVSVQNCLHKIVEGDEVSPPDKSVFGTLNYLMIVWCYVEIYFSPKASLNERIRYAGYVVHFLGIWRNFIFLHKNLSLKSHFITRESYQDALISSHFAVILICFMRDNFPDIEC